MAGNTLHEQVGSWRISMFLSFLVLCIHSVFIYGQLSDLWKFEVALYTQDVTLNGTLLDVFDVDVTLNDTDTIFIIQNYSYIDTMTRLWKFGDKGTFTWYDFSAHASESRIAVILIALFSGVWPHTKLLLMHSLWYLKFNSGYRNKALYWLELFGKWSALDVFLVCYLVVLLHIEFDLTTTQLIDNLGTNLGPFFDSLNGTAFNDGLCELFIDQDVINSTKISQCETIGNPNITLI